MKKLKGALQRAVGMKTEVRDSWWRWVMYHKI